MIFNLYTYDITNVLPDDAFILQYADDTQILLSFNKSTSLNSIENKINNILFAIETWSNQNCVSRNLPKTKILSIYIKNGKFCRMNLFSNDFSNFTFAKEAKNLGIIYSYNMSWKNHFITLLKSTRRILYYSRSFSARYINKSQIHIRYKLFSYILRPKMCYGIEIFVMM